MQLLLLLMLALANGNADSFKDVKSIMEGLGGGEALEVVKKAEEISAMLTAVQRLTGNGGNGGMGGNGGNGGNAPFKGAAGAKGCAMQIAGGDSIDDASPLAPVSAIADEYITSCLSRYISLGE